MTSSRQLFLPIYILFLFVTSPTHAQRPSPIETVPRDTDTLSTWWNLLHYDIDIEPNLSNHSLQGTVAITFQVVHPQPTLRIELLDSLHIQSVQWNRTSLDCKAHDGSVYIRFPKRLLPNAIETIIIRYEGNPQEAVKPPWGQGGWIWSKDELGNPWISLACEGSGARVWMPCKAALYDEPDSGINFRIVVPDSLVAVANGRLIRTEQLPSGKRAFYWKTTSPINNYDICPYIGKYIQWENIYQGINGPLNCNFYVLQTHQRKAKPYLTLATDSMLRCYESWLGPYPFYTDGYKLVDAPFLGMEHQSAIAYGNQFEPGYRNGNLSGTKWGLQWDFILVHESGHEWFGNSITACSGSHSWIHEGFTKYLEVLYVDYYFGKAAGNEYMHGIWKRIKNDAPIIGSGSSDEYNKGAALLHMVRQYTGDSSFRNLLRGMNRVFYHATISTGEVEKFFTDFTHFNWAPVFEQYLTTIDIPVLEYKWDANKLSYRWTNCVPLFNMPVKILLNGNAHWLQPGINWQMENVAGPETIEIDPEFYIKLKAA